MYDVLIAEDEILERCMLEKMVRKEFPRIRRIDLAENGQDALALARAKQPDILLADINMPGMSGLELISALIKEQIFCHIIFITAYDKFQYAQRAIDYGVEGYLLKPVSVRELRRNMERCFDSLDQAQAAAQRTQLDQRAILTLTNYVKPRLLQDMLAGVMPEDTLRSACGWPDESDLACAAVWLEFPHMPAQERIDIVVQALSEAGSAYFSTVSVPEGKSVFVALRALQPMEREQFTIALWLLIGILRQSLAQEVSFSVLTSPSLSTYEALRDALAQRTPFCRWEADIPARFLPQNNALSSKERRQRKQKALLRLREKDVSRIMSLFSRLIADPALCWWGVYYLMDACIGQLDPASMLEMICLTKRDTIAKDVRQYLQNMLDESDHIPIDDAIMDKALGLMDRHYTSANFSQAWLAEELGLSQAYFCRLFKKKTGMNFVAMLTKTRIDRAITLLKAGTSIQSTAEQCGYQSAKYFSDSFRQLYGMSAGQYQRMLMNTGKERTYEE